MSKNTNKNTKKTVNKATGRIQITDKASCVWGGVKGKLIAACLVLAFVCGVLALAFSYAMHGDVLLDTEQVVVNSSVDNGDNSVAVKLRLEKNGFFLSDIKTRKDGDKLFVKLYSSVTPSDKYKMDSTGHYVVDLSFDEDIKQIVQEGKNDDEATLVTLNHKG